MIKLYQGPAAWGIANVSPFCLKLESYLRMAGIPYAVMPPAMNKAPKSKIPFIEEDGRLLGDSQLIIEHLKRKHGDTLDEKLSAEDKAKGHIVRRMLEESTYWHTVYVRWATEEGWQVYRPIFEAMFPPVVGKVLPGMIRRKVIRALHAQGLGRHKPEEILELGKEDISAVSRVLGDKQFLFGDRPTSFDATLYASIASITAFPVDSPFRKFTQEQRNLVQYVDRFQQRFYANWSPPA